MRQLDQQIADASVYPTISAYAKPGFSYQSDEANILRTNQRLGPNIGVSLNYTIFAGGKHKIERQNAKINWEKEQTSKVRLKLDLERQLQNAFLQWQNNREQLRIEQSNLPTFELNFQKTQEDFKRGLVNAADVRTAQLNLMSAKDRINNLYYNVKLSEIQLLQISGQLLNE